MEQVLLPALHLEAFPLMLAQTPLPLSVLHKMARPLRTPLPSLELEQHQQSQLAQPALMRALVIKQL
jgi:hypothetical protein